MTAIVMGLIFSVMACYMQDSRAGFAQNEISLNIGER